MPEGTSTLKELSDIRVNIAEITTTSRDQSRRLETIDHTLKDIQMSLTGLELLKSKVENNDDRIWALETQMTWVVRLVVGTVVSALVGLVVFKTGVLSK